MVHSPGPVPGPDKGKAVKRTTLTILTALTALLMTSAVRAQNMDYRFHWSPSPIVDEENQAFSLAVHYEVWLKKGNDAEELVSSGRRDTTYTLSVEPGIVHRIRVRGVDSRGRSGDMSEWSDPIFIEESRGGEAPPLAAQLRSNYPNPFNPETTIRYGVPQDIQEGDLARLDIYNLAGQRVRTFEVARTPGWHEAVWDGTDESGQVQATGMYVTRLMVGSMVTTNKMTMLK